MNDRTDVKSMKMLIDLIKIMQYKFNQLNRGKISFAEFEVEMNKYLVGKQALLVHVLINAARIREQQDDSLVRELVASA